MSDEDLEAQLEARLGDWRSEEKKESTVKRVPKKLKKRKRRINPSTTSKDVTSEPTTSTLPDDSKESQIIVPDTSVPPEVESAALSRTLLRSRGGQKWNSISGKGLRKPTGIVKKQRKTKPVEPKKEVNAAQFVERFRHEVGALGAGGLQKRQRKAYDEALLTRLGFREPRRQKIPLTILEGMRRAEKKRQEKEKEKKREEGVLLSVKKKYRRR